MAGFTGIKALVDAELDGKFRVSSWRKTPSQITTIGIWFDLSMSPGNPNPQYYIGVPLEATPMARSTLGGFDHGQSVSGEKYLRSSLVLSNSATGLPLTLILQDYLMFYSFIDESLDGEAQVMDNSETLTRYTDGAGVQIMPVIVAGHSVGGATFTVSYTNQDGVSGRTTVAATLNTTQFVNGTILTSNRAQAGCTSPYLTLQGTDTGVRSIQSVTMSGSDVGLFALVLVKPLLTTQILEQTAPVEVDPLLLQGMIAPEIENDAFLSFIALPSASLAGVSLYGMIKTVWT